MNSTLLDLVFAHDGLAEVDAAQRRLWLREIATPYVPADRLPATVKELADLIDGFGPLSDLMRDRSITDILVNGPDEIWIERDGKLQRTAVRFDTPEQLDHLIERLLGDAGERIDLAKPIADARLEDGSRLHVVLPPLAPKGPLVSIRRFPARALQLHDLVDLGMLDRSNADALCAATQDRRTIVITGGTGTGKTTLLNALLSEVPSTERVVTIEETAELRPGCAHAVALVARDANVESAGSTDMLSLLRAALRMRPDRIVVGEVRGPEALVALDAMSTGHPGSMLTLHARSAVDAIDRMTALALSAGTRASEATLRFSVEQAFDVIVHLARKGAERRVVAIDFGR